MSKSNGQGCNKYAYLRCLSIDELLALLEAAPIPAATPEKEAYVSALKEAIIEKENEDPTGFFPDVDQQWSEFVAYYMLSTNKIESESKNLEHNTASLQMAQSSTNVPSKRLIRFNQVRRTVLIAAAAIICMFAVMVTAQAAGVDVFGAMARWTKDIFSFGQIAPNSEVSDGLNQETMETEIEISALGAEFATLQEAFDAYNITEVYEPGWLPYGYVLETLDVLAMEDPFLRTFSAFYTDGQGHVSVNVMSYEGEPSTLVQKTDTQPEIITQNGIIMQLKQDCKIPVCHKVLIYEYFL